MKTIFSRPIQSRIVTLYIFGQLAWPFLTTLALTSMILMVMQMLQLGDIVFGTAVSAGFILKVVFLTLPHFLVFTLPLAVLAALLIAYGRMVDENELLALEAGGISPSIKYNAPVLLGILASAVCFASHLFLEPWSMGEVYHHVVNVLKENATYTFQAGTFNDDIPDTVIFFDKKDEQDPRIWKKIFIFQTNNFGDQLFISAKSALVQPIQGRNNIKIEMRNGVVHQPNERKGIYRLINFNTNSIAIDIERIIHNKTGFFQQTLAMYPSELKKEIQAMPPGSKDRLKMEVIYHKRFATALMPLFLVLATTPLVAIRSRFGRPLNLGFIVGILLLYYLSMRITSSAGEVGRISPMLAAWAPDILLFLVALATGRIGRVSA